MDGASSDKPERLKVARAFLAQAKQETEVQRYKDLLIDARAKEKPIYKKWWFWVAIGGAVAVTAGVTAGIVVGTRKNDLPVERMTGTNHFEIMF